MLLQNASNYGVTPNNPADIKLKRTMLISLIVSFSLSALVGILFVALGEFGEVQLKILGTTTSAGWFSLLGLCGAIWFDRNKYLPLSYSTIAASGLALLYSIVIIWDVIEIDDFGFLKPLIILGIVAATLAHASLMMLSYGSNHNVNMAAAATITASGFLALVSIYFVLAEDGPTEGFARFLGVVAIVGVLGTIVTPLMKKTATLESKSAF